MDKKKHLSAEVSAGVISNAKKPYKKPSFQYEKVFEAMALSCGKINSTQLQCRFDRKKS
jgi:hypothetical protein